MKLKAFQLTDTLKKAEAVPRVVSIVGSEEFLSREAVHSILERIHGPTPRQEDVLRVQASSTPTDTEVTAILDELRTPSLFGEHRSIVLHNAEQFLTNEPELWLSVLASGWEQACLILVLQNLDGRTKMARTLEKLGWLITVAKPFHRPPPWKPTAKPWENELNAWLVSRAAIKGLRLAAPAAHLIQTRVGTDLGSLAATLERLQTVLPDGGEVSRELIEKHTPSGEESSLFELVDVFFLGERSRALRLAREVLHRGSLDSRGIRTSDPASLLLGFMGAAIRRARQLRELHRILSQGGNEQDLLEGTGIPRPFLPRLRQQARATSPEALKSIFQEFRHADRSLKEGWGPLAGEILERLMVKAY